MMQHFRATRFFVADEMNLVFDMQWGNFDADPEKELLVVASDGFRLVTLDRRTKLFIPFQPASVWSARAITLPNQSGFGFVASLPDQGRIAMYGWDGKIIWSSPSHKYTDLTVTDLDADGNQEILSAGDGLKLYSADGELMRTFSEDYCVTAAVLPNAAAGARIACVLWKMGRIADTVTIFSAEGKIVHTWKPPFEFYKFSAVTDWAGIWRLMLLNGDAIALYDAEGRKVRRLDAPGANGLPIPLGRRFHSQQRDIMFAVATGKGAMHKHAIFAYSDAGELIDTTLGEDDACSVLAVDADLPAGHHPFVLVGTRGEIWKYAE